MVTKRLLVICATIVLSSLFIGMGIAGAADAFAIMVVFGTGIGLFTFFVFAHAKASPPGQGTEQAQPHVDNPPGGVAR